MIRKKIDKPLEVRFKIRVQYPRWLANVIIVKKSNGSYKIYVDYTDFSKTYPKDNYSLLHIVQLVDATSGHELLIFMNVFS